MSLDVALRVGPRTSTLWSQSTSSNSKWHLGEVTVGSVPQDFNIVIQFTGKLAHGDYFAIDDIEFTNCSLPGKPSAQWDTKKKKEKKR